MGGRRAETYKAQHAQCNVDERIAGADSSLHPDYIRAVSIELLDFRGIGSFLPGRGGNRMARTIKKQSDEHIVFEATGVVVSWVGYRFLSAVGWCLSNIRGDSS